MCDDGSDLYASDQRHPAPTEWAAGRKCIIARAHEQQRQVIRQMVGRHVGVFGGSGAPCIGLSMRFRKHPVVILLSGCGDLRELSAKSDIELRDIGISRLEIRAAMRSNPKFCRGDGSAEWFEGSCLRRQGSHVRQVSGAPVQN